VAGDTGAVSAPIAVFNRSLTKSWTRLGVTGRPCRTTTSFEVGEGVDEVAEPAVQALLDELRRKLGREEAAGLPDRPADSRRLRDRTPDRRMAVELGDEANIGAFRSGPNPACSANGINHGTEHLAKIGHTTSRLYLCEYRLPVGLSISGTRYPKTAASRSAFVPKLILQPGHVLLPGRQVELAQGDAVDAAFGEQAFGGQDQPVAAVPCIASKRLSLHETD